MVESFQRGPNPPRLLRNGPKGNFFSLVKTNVQRALEQIEEFINGAEVLNQADSVSQSGPLSIYNNSGLPSLNIETAGSGVDIDGTNSSWSASRTGVLTCLRLASTQTTGTAPFTVSSTTVVPNLNVDQVDGRDETEFALLAGRSGGQILFGGTDANDDLTLRSTANATKGDIILADDAGLVGIGSASVGAKLDVDGDFQADRGRFGSTADGAALGDFAAGVVSAARIFYDQSTTLFELYESAGDVSARLSGVAGTATEFNIGELDQDFIVNGVGPTLLVVDAGENRVGIKTASPGSLLDVRGGDLRVGTATDTATSGDFVAGLASAARIFFDQSAQFLRMFDSVDNITMTFSSVAGTDNAINEDQQDIDTLIGGNGQQLALFDAGLLQVRIGTGAPTSKLDVGGDIEVGSADAIYFGDPTTDGTWRQMRSGNDFVFQRRETGSYVTKSTISA